MNKILLIGDPQIRSTKEAQFTAQQILCDAGFECVCAETHTNGMAEFISATASGREFAAIVVAHSEGNYAELNSVMFGAVIEAFCKKNNQLQPMVIVDHNRLSYPGYTVWIDSCAPADEFVEAVKNQLKNHDSLAMDQIT